MINIRYHIVSITAVFLALGVGTALGSTFLEGNTVSLLDRNIRGAESQISDARQENDRLDAELAAARERDAALIERAGEAVDERLLDRPVLVVFAPGTDQALVDGVLRLVTEAGADLRGTLELREQMAFSGEADPELALALDVEGADAEELRTAVYDQLRTAMVAAGGAPPEGADGEGPPDGTEPGAEPPSPDPPEEGTTVPPADPGPTTGPAPTTTPGTTAGEATTEPEGEGEDAPRSTDENGGAGPAAAEIPDGDQPDVISALLSTGHVQITPGPGHDVGEPILETTGYRYVFVSAPGEDVAANEMLSDLLPVAALDEVAPVVVVGATVTEPDDDAPPRDAVERIRSTAERASLYSTVDNAETFSGLLATVLSLEDLDEGIRGHYGQADGATAVLPPGS
ncbi:copper transporter [Iamia sp.]|uniref:copper transporter n=1 Tax=Iamia sp. TaxID=2722710 RepID=UPI002B895035|nr:copper transporter [Iamia sp.]HXH59063.1 copper transporter [Iamia sp.]